MGCRACRRLTLVAVRRSPRLWPLVLIWLLPPVLLAIDEDLCAIVVVETQLDPSADHAQNVTRDTILAAPVGDRLQFVEAYLRETIGKVVGAPAAKIALDRPLSELGMDSLMAIELTMRLEADLGLAVSSGTVLGGENVPRLAESLASLLENAGDTAAHKP